MADVLRSQALETNALLTENTPQAGVSYRDNPEIEQQDLNPSMTLSNQPAAGDSVELILPQDPGEMQISKPEGRGGDTLGVGLVIGGSLVRPMHTGHSARVGLM